MVATPGLGTSHLGRRRDRFRQGLSSVVAHCRPCSRNLGRLDSRVGGRPQGRYGVWPRTDALQRVRVRQWPNHCRASTGCDRKSCSTAQRLRGHTRLYSPSVDEPLIVLIVDEIASLAAADWNAMTTLAGALVGTVSGSLPGLGGRGHFRSMYRGPHRRSRRMPGAGCQHGRVDLDSPPPNNPSPGGLVGKTPRESALGKFR